MAILEFSGGKALEAVSECPPGHHYLEWVRGGQCEGAELKKAGITGSMPKIW